MDETYAVAAGILMVYWVIVLVIAVVCLVGMWKMFVKAGKPGWGAIIPFYNTYCLFEMSFGTGWLFLLLFRPCFNGLFLFGMLYYPGTGFGKGAAFGVGILFLPFIFLPMLGFGDAQFIGPVKK